MQKQKSIKHNRIADVGYVVLVKKDQSHHKRKQQISAKD